jgi:hypothetical protein
MSFSDAPLTSIAILFNFVQFGPHIAMGAFGLTGASDDLVFLVLAFFIYFRAV